MNGYEVHNRRRKVEALTAAARRLHVSPTQVATDADTRAQLVTAAGVTAPSATTWKWVMQAMARDGVYVP